MGKMVKCRACGKQFDRDEAIVIGKRTYVCCDECRQAYESKPTVVKNRAAKQSTSIQDGYRDLTDYINANVAEPNWILFTAQIKRMLQDYPAMNYRGMLYTLWYIKNIVGRELTGVSMVPYHYEAAKRHYEWKQQIKRQIEDTKFVTTEQTIERSNKHDETIFD